ncbi:uncharacterized protein LOC116247537 [Nymphaea colorata]|nr:uncharacterized protein LOC116247537 [Nymphaea colorata]
MDLNSTDVSFPQMLGSRSDTCNLPSCSTGLGFGDTTLRLDCCGYNQDHDKGPAGVHMISASAYSPNSLEDVSYDDGCTLVLGLGPAGSSSFDSLGINRVKALGGLIFQEFSGSPQHSSPFLQSQTQDKLAESGNGIQVSIVDEGSTSAARRRSGGCMQSLVDTSSFSSRHIQNVRDLEVGCSFNLQVHSNPSSAAESLQGAMSGNTGVEVPDHRSHPRRCRFRGCTKGARGASGLCIAHGGGQRCQKPGCNKGAESRTVYCKAHGGGRRCESLGCTKSAEGKTDYCIGHGGGRRCGHPGCTKAARGKSGLCIRHGGGKRCKVDGCTRSAEGFLGLCISHGGGRRCQYPACNKGAQGSTSFCKAHGGGKRCIFAGCNKGAEGSTPLCKGHGGGKRCMFGGGGVCPKSVHGGTNFCVAHGGGKRCAVPGCTKSARGRTDCCVRHGGGKRCHFEGCGKSAQGSTNFCKAHGGGKRCMWGQEGTVYAGVLVKGKNGEIQTGPCDKFARGKSGLCAAHGSLVQAMIPGTAEGNTGISPGLFRGLAHPSTGNSGDDDSSGASTVSELAIDCTQSADESSRSHNHLIPPQVLVPPSMKSPSLFGLGSEKGASMPAPSNISSTLAVPEGRVHGGSLMFLLGGDLKAAADRVF